MKILPELHYTTDHEWISGEGKIGITDFAQDQLGDVVYLDFAVAVGDEVNKGDTLGTVESVKTVSDIYAPVAGTVKALNEGIADSPESVNSDPYGGGWMFQLDVSDAGALSALMSPEDYKKHIGE